MTKVYNVWLDIEEYDEESDMEGHDIDTIKLGKFETPKDAVLFHSAVTKMALAVVKMYPGRIENKKKPTVLNPSCSEAVIKFMTLEPEKMQAILQAIKDEIISKYPKGERDWLHPGRKIPLLAKAKMYDTKWNGELTYSGTVRAKYDKQINDNWRKRDEEIITQEQALINYGKIVAKMNKEIYPKSMLKACAGLGDNDAVITVQRDGFILNIGNNDLLPTNKTDSNLPRYEKIGKKRKLNWVELVESMDIKVQEAEYSEELHAMRRDCTCGESWFDNYKNLIKDPDFGKLLQTAGLAIKLDLPTYLEDKDGKLLRDVRGDARKNPERENADSFQDLFRFWRAGKGIKPHLTTVEDAKFFMKEPFTNDMIKRIETTMDDELINEMKEYGRDAKSLEQKRKALVKKYRKKKSKSKAFTVSSKDLFDRKKNPNLSLSVEDVMKNKKIPKKML
jgi:hypothetical protein